MGIFPEEAELKSSLPGLRYPAFRDAPLKSAAVWLQGKRKDDNTSGLWRVHDDLYDFSSWIDKHPGGADWIKFTKGTDITEAFETHHISKKAELMLKQFHVRKVTGPRNSPFTFKDEGFYRTLKKNVRKVMSDNTPGIAWKSMAIADSLLGSSFGTAILAASMGSFVMATVSGVLLALTIISAHNFFHQRDNLRMYYFDISFMSSRHWRVSHAMSHHLFTNTMLDLEISMLEPFLQLLPRKSKPLLVRYGSWIASPIFYASLIPHQIVTRIALVAYGYPGSVRKEDLLPLVVPLSMLMFGKTDIKTTLLLWIWNMLVTSFTFSIIGLTAAHHHPNVFHDGDAPRVDRDWGLAQMDAVRDRHGINKSLFLVLVTFGDHCLHHLFPTLDHSYLQQIRPAFDETCKQFGIVYKPSSIVKMIKGPFQQLSNNVPNPVTPGNIID